MRQTVVKFGLLSGAVSAVLMLATLPFIDAIGFDRGEIVGYTAMILSFLFVFFGIRAYRDTSGNGRITFARGLSVGLLITLISCVCYVLTWEVVYFKFMPDFGDKYAAYMIQHARAAGASAEAIAAAARQAQEFKQMYDNLLFNAGVTFLEPLPVGFVMTLLSAVILRKR